MIINNTNEALESYVRTVMSQADDVLGKLPTLEKVESDEDLTYYKRNLKEVKNFASEFFKGFKQIFSGDLHIGLKRMIDNHGSNINEKLDLLKEKKFIGFQETTFMREEIVDMITTEEDFSDVMEEQLVTIAVSLEVAVVALETSAKFIKEKIDTVSKPPFQKICKEAKEASRCLVQLEKLLATMEEGEARDDVIRIQKELKSGLRNMNEVSLKCNEYSYDVAQIILNNPENNLVPLLEGISNNENVLSSTQKIVNFIQEKRKTINIPHKIFSAAVTLIIVQKALPNFVKEGLSIIKERVPKYGDDESTANAKMERLWGYDLPEGEEDRQHLISFEGEQVLLQRTKQSLPKLSLILRSESHDY